MGKAILFFCFFLFFVFFFAKAKMSLVKLGNKSRPKGYKHTEETIAKIKLAQQNRTKLPKPGISVKILDLKTYLKVYRALKN